MTPSPKLSSRFEEALIYATRLHARQTRKRASTPYVAHLLSVTALVLESGGGEDEAIAALLHDAVEDQGGKKTLKEIQQRFGDEVANIVESCTDAYLFPKPPWRQRKESYIAHLLKASPEARRVSLADKLHNARSILRDLRLEGEGTWDKFNGGKEGTLWYYRTLLDSFMSIDNNNFMVDELERVVIEIEWLAKPTTDANAKGGPAAGAP
ncbi:MAG: HD domain-containing protein [Anaerolineales bacterium]|nr:HD domain-containing protein [Chloroflexota bacterium]MBL7162657.1 HD domain-containing protein [Anaerolineales bacterium]